MANEKRLIDANGRYTIYANDYPGYSICFSGGIISVFYDFGRCVCEFDAEDAPTVDAVEVVRCKDCKHWLHIEDGFGDCTNGRFHLDNHADPTMEADDFCSCGERKDKDA